MHDARERVPARQRHQRRARWPVKVGQPTWSSTTVSESRSAASRSIVAGKHGPPLPNSHELRTIVWRSGAPSATARSPTSFVEP